MLWRISFMFLKQVKNYKGRIFLQVVEGFRNEKGKPSHRVVEKLGYLDELAQRDGISETEALEKYKDYAKNYDIDKKPLLNVTFSSTEEIAQDGSRLKKVGYLAVKPIVKALNIKPIIDAINEKHQSEASLFEIFNFLLYSKIVYADSRRSSYLKRNTFFENFSFSEDQMYRAMTYIGESWENIKDAVFHNTDDAYGLDTRKTYYDGTNFYFEIDQMDDFRRKGPSKENRVEPLVSVGLLLDNNYIPIDIKIYPGNESEKGHFNTVLNEMKEKNKIKGKTVYIADKGLNTGQNIFDCIKNKDGYIYSQSVRGASLATKKYITNDADFIPVFNEDNEIEYYFKSHVFTDVEISFEYNGKTHKEKVTQRRVVTFNPSAAKKTEIERNRLIQKAKALIKRPSEFDKERLGEASKYIKSIKFDKDGVVITPQNLLQIDQEKIDQEKQLDGYYLIVTSEIDMKPNEILRAYRNLSNIENSFRVEKSYLKLRPAFVSREERIKCHVLISYLALLVLRLLEIKVLKRKYCIEHIIDSIREYECCEIAQNTYFFFKYNDVMVDLASKGPISAKMSVHTLSEIKKMFKY